MKDILIIGAGPGGYELALEAAKNNLSVTLIEKDQVGGTCLQRGCIPTKTYYTSAKIIKDFSKHSTFGISSNYEFDFKKLKEKKDNVVSELTKGIRFLLEKSNVEIIKGEAKFVDKNTIEVNGELYQGKNIVIATGSIPIKTNFPGNDLKKVMTTNEFLNIDEIPKKLVIVGSGVIGIEIASIFNKFGSDVTIIEMLDRILPTTDLEVAKRLLVYLKKQGIKFILNSKVVEAKEENDYLSISYIEKEVKKVIDADVLLVAVGRKANYQGLELDKINLLYSSKGIICDEDFKTNIDNIYAIGDVTGKMMLAHSATYSGFHVLNKILNKLDKIDFKLIPSCIFSFPEVASIGLTEEDLKNSNCLYNVNKSYYMSNGKAQTMDEVDGFIKIIIVDSKIVGCHIIGYEASDLIHILIPYMAYNITIEEVKNIIFAHPTISEIVGSVLK